MLRLPLFSFSSPKAYFPHQLIIGLLFFVLELSADSCDQDKHAKQLASKLAARLPRAESERQWNDVAFALGLLQHKDEEIQKLVGEGFKVVQAVA
jgi:condensin complex subunit 1